MIEQKKTNKFRCFSAMNQGNGSWNETALSYECRSMLFKALHNMIEKYVR